MTNGVYEFDKDPVALNEATIFFTYLPCHAMFSIICALID